MLKTYVLSNKEGGEKVMKTNKKPKGEYALFCVEVVCDGIPSYDLYFAHNCLNAIACYKRQHPDEAPEIVNCHKFKKISDVGVFNEVQ